MHRDVEALLEKNRAGITDLCRRYSVVRLRVFGSALTDGWDPVHSDLDFLAEYGPERSRLSPWDALVGLQMELERLLGTRVDVVDWHAAVNPYFKAQAEKQAMVLYAG